MGEKDSKEKIPLWLIRYRIAKFMGWKLYKVRHPESIDASPYLWNHPDDDRVPNDQWPEHKELDPFEILGQFDFKGVPDFPGDDSAALSILEKWTDAEFEKAGNNWVVTLIGAPIVTNSAKTLSLAICKAVLMAEDETMERYKNGKE